MARVGRRWLDAVSHEVYDASVNQNEQRTTGNAPTDNAVPADKARI
jgi:hypothetical protein